MDLEVDRHDYCPEWYLINSMDGLGFQKVAMVVDLEKGLRGQPVMLPYNSVGMGNENYCIP